MSCFRRRRPMPSWRFDKELLEARASMCTPIIASRCRTTTRRWSNARRIGDASWARTASRSISSASSRTSPNAHARERAHRSPRPSRRADRSAATRAVREQLDQALARVGRGELLAVLYLDLDLFKDVNDTLGHPVGDALLQVVADRLRDCVRATKFAAFGGDEFAVIQASIEQPSDASRWRCGSARRSGRRLLARRPPEVVSSERSAVARSPSRRSTRPSGTELLKHRRHGASTGPPKAPGAAPTRFFEPEMNERMQSRHELERDLRRRSPTASSSCTTSRSSTCATIRSADARRFCAGTTRRAACPARRVHSRPAEEIGLINPLGEWVIRTACATAAAWPESIKVSINLSPAQLKATICCRS